MKAHELKEGMEIQHVESGEVRKVTKINFNTYEFQYSKIGAIGMSKDFFAGLSKWNEVKEKEDPEFTFQVQIEGVALKQEKLEQFTFDVEKFATDYEMCVNSSKITREKTKPSFALDIESKADMMDSFRYMMKSDETVRKLCRDIPIQSQSSDFDSKKLNTVKSMTKYFEAKFNSDFRKIRGTPRILINSVISQVVGKLAFNNPEFCGVEFDNEFLALVDNLLDRRLKSRIRFQEKRRSPSIQLKRKPIRKPVIDWDDEDDDEDDDE